MPNAPHSRIIFPLDVSSEAEAWQWCFKLKAKVGYMKVGLELFTSLGPTILNAPRANGFGIMLDLKLHDIPATVGKAAEAAAKLGADLITVHASGGPTMLKEAVKAVGSVNPKARILAVTVLTSLSEDDITKTFGLSKPYDITQLVMRMGMMATEQGVRGFVCSPQEVEALRRVVPKDALIVVPGVRPAGADVNDQKRVATPGKAMKDGADLLVIGRPIRDAQDPVAAAKAIAEEISLFVPSSV